MFICSRVSSRKRPFNPYISSGHFWEPAQVTDTFFASRSRVPAYENFHCISWYKQNFKGVLLEKDRRHWIQRLQILFKYRLNITCWQTFKSRSPLLSYQRPVFTDYIAPLGRSTFFVHTLLSMVFFNRGRGFFSSKKRTKFGLFGWVFSKVPTKNDPFWLQSINQSINQFINDIALGTSNYFDGTACRPRACEHLPLLWLLKLLFWSLVK